MISAISFFKKANIICEHNKYNTCDKCPLYIYCEDGIFTQTDQHEELIKLVEEYSNK